MGDGTAPNGQNRLDSWKAIAAYLGRDERTAQRWEKQLGLPIRRLPGGRGTSVFAYASEIDTWLKATPAAISEQPPEVRSDPPTDTQHGRRSWRVAALGVAILTAGISAALVMQRPDPSLTRVDVTPSGVIATAADHEEWRFAFPSDQRVTLPDWRRQETADIVGGPHPGVVAATQLSVRTSDESVRGGALLWFSARGALQHLLMLDDRPRFAAGEYGAPWAITDFRVSPDGGDLRVALAAHHYEWWPSVITILDRQWRRTATFVNAGWLERVHWLSPDRLLVAGFSESQNGGMVAILDPTAMNGQSPEIEGSKFFCTGCGADRPLRSIILPRSEVNLASGSRFNRARLGILDGLIVVRTAEVPLGDVEAIDAIYSFTPDLRLLRAEFSERYWDMHATLQARGVLNHGRDACPDRDGPRGMRAWELGTGWQPLRSAAP